MTRIFVLYNKDKPIAASYNKLILTHHVAKNMIFNCEITNVEVLE